MSLVSSLTSLSRSLRQRKIGSDHIFINRAGQKFREARGMDRSGNETGPLHDLFDYHFIDGTVPPETMKQKKWKLKRERIQNRIEKLGNEMIKLHLEWQQYDEMQQQKGENNNEETLEEKQ